MSLPSLTVVLRHRLPVFQHNTTWKQAGSIVDRVLGKKGDVVEEQTKDAFWTERKAGEGQLTKSGDVVMTKVHEVKTTLNQLGAATLKVRCASCNVGTLRDACILLMYTSAPLRRVTCMACGRAERQQGVAGHAQTRSSAWFPALPLQVANKEGRAAASEQLRAEEVLHAVQSKPGLAGPEKVAAALANIAEACELGQQQGAQAMARHVEECLPEDGRSVQVVKDVQANADRLLEKEAGAMRPNNIQRTAAAHMAALDSMPGAYYRKMLSAYSLAAVS
jgi:hypothetical protein